MARERDPQLVLLDESETVFELPEGRTRIGRAPGNELRLEDTTVSRFHCHVVRSGREVRVGDADSHNSTRVNGRHAADTPLANGDILRVGRLRLRYHDPELAISAARARRASKKKRMPALFPLLCLLVSVLALSWLYIASKYSVGRSRAAVASRDDRGLTSELLETQRQLRMQDARLEEVKSRFQEAQASLVSLQKEYQRELSALRQEYEGEKGAAESRELHRQILSLESTIRDLGERSEADRQRFLKELEATKAAVSAGGSAPGGTTSRYRTVVSKVESRPALSENEVEDLVETLRSALENYASPEATPETLEPALGRLSLSGGREAAGGMLAVLEHSRKLLKDLDENVAFLKRRTDGLLADAAAAGGSTSEGSGRKKEGSSYTAGPELEKLQRALELSERKIAIKKTQRERLSALADTVKDAFGRVTDAAAIEYLLRVFARDRDPEKRLAILGAVRASAPPEAIPVLIKRFTTQDEAVRRAVRETLIALAGKDLGDTKSAWETWSAEQKR